MIDRVFRGLHAVVVCLILSAPLQARAQATADSAIFAVEGSFFSVSVPDLGASIRWYVEKLGLRVRTSFPPQGGVTGAILEGGGLEVELLSHTGAATVGDPMDAGAKVLTRGIIKVGFRVVDLDRAVATMRRVRSISAAARSARQCAHS
jgi:hypothetical protein